MIKQKFNTVTSKLIKNLKAGDDDSLFPSNLGIAIVMILGVLAAIIQYPREKIETPQNLVTESMDTYIPNHESLVPIKVSNYESLDQIIGKFGVVDLYSTPLDPTEKPRRIAFAVKMVRTSNSPGHFSVLVPADKAYKLAGIQGEFTAVVRNPKLIGTKFVNKQAKAPKRRVIYHWEER